MKASVNQEICIGCGLCASICPEVFVLGDQMTSQVIADPVPESAEEAARNAAESCPVEAITLIG
mgnify:CR=1 FL=1